MAGAAERLKQQANVNFQQMSVQTVDALDQALDAFKLRILNDLKELKAHPDRLADLTVSDGDYELKPPKPHIEKKNGNKPALEDVREEVTA